MTHRSNDLQETVILPSFIDQFLHWVNTTPEREAVSDSELQFSYDQLSNRMRVLASRLKSEGVKPGDRVIVDLTRNTDLVVALLATFYVGGVYVPIDPTNPTERISTIIKDADASVIVADPETTPNLVLNGISKVVLEKGWADSIQIPLDASFHGDQNDLSNLIYTSGSTGKPKGVATRHSGLTNILESLRKKLRFTESDRMFAVTTAAFDASLLELCLPLWCGGCVEIANETMRRDPSGLLERMIEVPITVMFGTPASWQMLVDRGWQGTPNLKAISGGETLSRELANCLLERSSEVWNIYGPTETTICSTCIQVEDNNEEVPIGWPIANTSLQIFNNERQLVTDGTPGELYIGGDGLAQGYYGQPELTKNSFIDDPFNSQDRLYRTGDVVRRRPDGALLYLGRTDTQIKLRGYRIEPGEIEAALQDHRDVSHAIVVLGGNFLADRFLEAFVISDCELDPAALMVHLRARIPSYMVPSRLTPIDAFPLTPNGKIDRNALSALATSYESNSIELPRTDLEVKIALIWRESFERDIDRRGNFFEHGGNSLMAIVLLSRIEEQLGVKIPFGVFFDQPTIAGLAEFLEVQHSESVSSVPVLLNDNNGYETPLFCIDGVHLYQALAMALKHVLPVYGVYMDEGQQLLADLSRGNLSHSLANPQIAAKAYIKLLREQQPSGPYRLAGFSYGGIVAFEMAQQLIQEDEVVETLILLDTPLSRSIERTKGPCAYLKYLLRLHWQKRFFQFNSSKSVDPLRLIAADRYENAIDAYPGRALLCRATDESLVRRELDESLGWRDIIEVLTIEDCPGNHFGMLTEENSVSLASVIEKYLIQQSQPSPAKSIIQ